MRILPIQSNQNQVSHKAVNQKFLKQAKEEFRINPSHPHIGHLLTMIKINETYGLISTQDVIDTLEAIKPYAQNAIEVIEYMLQCRKNNN